MKKISIILGLSIAPLFLGCANQMLGTKCFDSLSTATTFGASDQCVSIEEYDRVMEEYAKKQFEADKQVYDMAQKAAKRAAEFLTEAEIQERNWFWEEIKEIEDQNQQELLIMLRKIQSPKTITVINEDGTSGTAQVIYTDTGVTIVRE